MAQLLAFQRIDLAPGEEAEVRFEVPTQRLSFTGVDGRRMVEPGDVTLWVGPSCAERETTARLVVDGPVYEVGLADPRTVRSEVERAPLRVG